MVEKFSSNAQCPAGRTNTTHYIELYDTHMDRKWFIDITSNVAYKSVGYERFYTNLLQ